MTGRQFGGWWIAFQGIGQNRPGIVHGILGDWFIHRTRRSWQRECAGFSAWIFAGLAPAAFKGADHTPTRPKGNGARRYGPCEASSA